jgi:hypothetical protein
MASQNPRRSSDGATVTTPGDSTTVVVPPECADEINMKPAQIVGDSVDERNTHELFSRPFDVEPCHRGVLRGRRDAPSRARGAARGGVRREPGVAAGARGPAAVGDAEGPMTDERREAVVHAMEAVMRERMRWSIPLSDDGWREDAEAVADTALNAIAETRGG